MRAERRVNLPTQFRTTLSRHTRKEKKRQLRGNHADPSHEMNADEARRGEARLCAMKAQAEQASAWGRVERRMAQNHNPPLSEALRLTFSTQLNSNQQILFFSFFSFFRLFFNTAFHTHSETMGSRLDCRTKLNLQDA